ncbi:MAG: galactose-1-phosphate uridylyltransferase, partial [Deltaproteobacteria bacterium]|nr:galactose-1-phosphate uridylyltransferase [Deltaproteobacteria bacterium]
LCPFCPGREALTPGEVLAFRSHGQPANGPGWSVRVVPNKLPVLRVEGSLQREGDGIYDRMNGLGAHEVVIESTEHRMRLGEMTVGEIEQVAWAWRDRIVDLRRDFRLQYVLVFKNDGVAAGALTAHPHSQLIALPIVPRQVAEEIAGAQRYFSFRERCIFCDMVRQELKDGQRLIFENTAFVVFAPFAQRFPFETWVLPRDHHASFQDCPRQVYRLLAEALKVALFKLDHALDRPHYSFILHNAPFQEDRAEHYHWHIEVMPALCGVSGFEWGSGFYINPTPPEESARFLREETPLGL